jgi:hypothetical protein
MPNTRRGFTHGGERFRQQLLQCFALLQTLTVLGGLRLQLLSDRASN